MVSRRRFIQGLAGCFISVPAVAKIIVPGDDVWTVSTDIEFMEMYRRQVVTGFEWSQALLRKQIDVDWHD